MSRSFITTVIAATGLIASVIPGFGYAQEKNETPVGPVAITSPPVDNSPNWTGFYAGGQLGFAGIEASPGSDDDSFIAGLTAGYDYDFDTFVLGGGLDYDFTYADVGKTGAALESIFRVRLRAGFELGQGLLYGTGGYAQVDTDVLGSEDGYFVGAGYEYLVTPGFSYGGEVLYQEFDSFGNTSTDLNATTVQLRGAFRF